MNTTPSVITSGEKDEYIFRTGDPELVRLGYQHRVWAESLFALWERAGVAPGMKMIDLGAGPGFCTVDLAHLVGPAGGVLAVDASERFLAHLRRKMAVEPLDNVETLECDAQTLDLPPASFDGAVARWLLCYLSDPLAALTGVASALKPGGVFTIQDYSNYRAIDVAPRSKAFSRVIEAVSKMWRDTGGDPDVGSHLPALLNRAGFDVREATTVVRSARPGSALWDWPTVFFRNFVPIMVKEGCLTEAEQDAYFAEWAELSNNPNAVFSTPPMMDLIAVKR